MEVTLKHAGEGGNIFSVHWAVEIVVRMHFCGKCLYYRVEVKQGENKGCSHTRPKCGEIYIYI